MMCGMVVIYIPKLGILDRAHITNLCRQVTIELMPKKNNPSSHMWHMDRGYMKARFHMLIGKRIIDITYID
jgi:hypothetical protein